MRDKNGWLAAIFQLNDGRDAGGSGMLDQLCESRDRRSVVDRDRRQFASTGERNFVKEFECEGRIAAEVEEVVVHFDQGELEHALPDRRQRVNRRCG